MLSAYLLTSITRGSFAALLLAVAAGSVAQAQVEPSLPPATPGPAPTTAGTEEIEGVETLTHGPIHEAFANPTDLDPTEIPSAPNQPPAEVAEEPPEFMPEGAIWIPGYWLWDDERDQYIWVTGAARVPPPNMKWVPGYYTEIAGAWQRVNGFWVSTEIPAVEYRAAPPPATLEVGPSSPAPADDHFWIPGAWNYYDTGYRWQAGYWAPYQPNWIWVPARWTWTPAGYVFCPGFWDHRMAYRGQIFAPIYFQQPVYTRPGWAYRPWCAIPTNNLFIHLWIRPRWNCYYFGNYYGANYANSGFVAWANIGVNSRQRFMYDPFFSYARVHYHRQGIDYIGRVQGWNRYYHDHNDLRPPRTWREQQVFLASNGRQRVETQLLAAPVTEIARRNDNPLRITRLDDQDRRSQQQAAERLREFNAERRRIERDAELINNRNPGRNRDNARDVAKGRNEDDSNDGKRGDDKRGEGPSVARPNANPGRGGSPRLNIPADLPGGDRRVVRNEQGDNQRDDNQRGEKKRGDNQRGDDDGARRSPPPQPRPGRVASDAGKIGPGNAGQGNPASAGNVNPRNPGRVSLDDDRGGKGGKAIDRVESTPPARAGGKANPGRSGRDAVTAEPRTPGPESATSNPGRPNATPSIDTTPNTDRGDRSPVAGGKSKSGNQGNAARGPDLGNGRGDTSRSLSRPDAGTALPAGTITPPAINPNRPPPRGNLELPTNRPETPRATPRPETTRPEVTRPQTTRPDATRGRDSQPGISQPGNFGGSRPTFNARGGNPGGAPESPRINIPETRGRDSSPRPSNQNKGGGRSNDNSNRGNEGASRYESPRSTLDRSSTAAMPRVQPRVEARVMPRVDTPSAPRSMPRVEAPRENRSPQRIETRSRPQPRSEDISPARNSRPDSRADRGSDRPAAEVAKAPESSKGKNKSRDRE